MNGQKMAPVVENGRRYFNFNLNAVYLCEDMTNVDQPRYITYKVLDCEIRNGREYYTIERDGKKMPAAITANRLNYILNFSLISTLDEGERKEIPLTLDDVRTYYAYIGEQRERQKRQLKEAIESDPAYLRLAKIKQHLTIKMAFAEVAGNFAEEAMYREEFDKIQKQLDSKASQDGIDLCLLREKSTCPYCNDTGVYHGAICKCAKSIEDKIKEFFARNNNSGR